LNDACVKSHNSQSWSLASEKILIHYSQKVNLLCKKSTFWAWYIRNINKNKTTNLFLNYIFQVPLLMNLLLNYKQLDILSVNGTGDGSLSNASLSVLYILFAQSLTTLFDISMSPSNLAKIVGLQ